MRPPEGRCYPGHNCPGLIEAGWPGSGGGGWGGYPGHNCPGLIEAPRGGRGSRNRTGVIRGITAPASLKHYQRFRAMVGNSQLSGA
ncbi:protein of unknown function [Candidatus Methylocalor cossyra]|uniref:Uncharacterized protein n=1 Tax=Candidatus Methylocalor cossyra TaxID=3108543 RepID=A0ABM9NJ11_9GAMM